MRSPIVAVLCTKHALKRTAQNAYLNNYSRGGVVWLLSSTLGACCHGNGGVKGNGNNHTCHLVLSMPWAGMVVSEC